MCVASQGGNVGSGVAWRAGRPGGEQAVNSAGMAAAKENRHQRWRCANNVSAISVSSV